MKKINKKHKRLVNSIAMGLLMSTVLGTYKLILNGGLHIYILQMLPISIAQSLIVSIPTSYFIGPYIFKITSLIVED